MTPKETNTTTTPIQTELAAKANDKKQEETLNDKRQEESVCLEVVCVSGWHSFTLSPFCHRHAVAVSLACLHSHGANIFNDART
jgi:hypothetical protein